MTDATSPLGFDSLSAFPAVVPLSPRHSDAPRSQGAPPDAANLPVARRRILHVINGEHYSGAERVQDLLALGLPANGYEVAFACLKDGKFKQVRKSQQVTLHDAPMRSRLDFRAVRALTRLAQDRAYELIHAHTPRSLLVGRLIAARLRLPLIYHVHSPAARDSTRYWTNRVNAWVEKLSLQGVSRLITVSESLANCMIASGTHPDAISVVPNGVPVASPRPPRAAHTATWTLGTVALFRPRKGTEILLAALAILKSRGIVVRLKAIGGWETAEYEASLKAHAARLGVESQVMWRGFCQDVDGELNEVDVLVLPSLFGEGMPMVVLEALAKGIPVVGTCVEGVPEVIRDGLEGRLAPPGDPAELAEAIASIVEGDLNWDELHAAARARHAMQYADDVMARGVARVYDEILDGPQEPAPQPDRATAQRIKLA